MFSRATDASKIALGCLCHRLAERGFALFDTQFITPHLRSLGGIEVPRAFYHEALEAALPLNVSFGPSGPLAAPQDVLQRNTHTS